MHMSRQCGAHQHQQNLINIPTRSSGADASEAPTIERSDTNNQRAPTSRPHTTNACDALRHDKCHSPFADADWPVHVIVEQEIGAVSKQGIGAVHSHVRTMCAHKQTRDIDANGVSSAFRVKGSHTHSLDATVALAPSNSQPTNMPTRQYHVEPSHTVCARTYCHTHHSLAPTHSQPINIPILRHSTFHLIFAQSTSAHNEKGTDCASYNNNKTSSNRNQYDQS